MKDKKKDKLREKGEPERGENEMQETAETPDEPETVTAGSDQAAAEDAEAKIAALTAERDDLLEFAKRQKADFLNYKRRTEMSRLEGEKDGVRDTVLQFLPVLDNL